MRLQILKYVLVFLFMILFSTIFWMQIIKGQEYFRQSESNRIRLVPEDASRGIIYDRNNKPLVENQLAFDVVAVPQEIKSENKDVLFAKLSKFLDIKASILAEAFERNFVSSFSPVMLAENIPRNTAFLIEQEMSELLGVFVKTSSIRNYLHGKSSAHLVGYVGKMREYEYPELKKYGYRMSDLIGRSGLEKEYDQILRGKPGGMQLEVDSEGSIIKVISYRPPVRGSDVHTTIDLDLQKLVSELMADTRGAVCVLDPDTGEVLALYSGPAYDPNIFINKNKYEEMGKVFKNPDAPLLNRALNTYAPGSIFKIVTAYAGLWEKIIDSNTCFVCEGNFQLGNSSRSCWLKQGHGSVNLQEALETSCNVFFWEVGLKIGQRLLSVHAREFGLGKQTGIDLPSEPSGVVPNANWKNANIHEKWYAGDTANFAIGQGFLLVSPIQAARMVSMVANGGYEILPRIVKKENKTINSKKKILSEEILAIIRKGLNDVVNASSGTGRNAYVPGVAIFAKTGTAQSGKGLDPHAWFVGSAEFKKQKISFSIFQEFGGHGGEGPANIAKQIILYFKAKEGEE
ncbi:MAG: penicillin-binding protein 2 [Candidatus Omnitrophica bacterium]|nr:penicillin-binding protein 2 [Candidatus Omnitrophota bacterium]